MRSAAHTYMLHKSFSEDISWEDLMEVAIYRFLNSLSLGKSGGDNIHDTPQRVVKAYKELVSGTEVELDDILKATFPISDSEMVIIKDIDFVSVCAHHLLPFYGKAHFGYIPNKTVIGLSKVPRLIKTMARKPTIQELLSNDIVAQFMRVLKPRGCGVVVEATHTCMSLRGIYANGAITRTQSLAGSFIKNQSVKQEFFEAIR